mgnify:FL=1
MLDGGRVEEVEVKTAGECCERCMRTEGCVWGVWEASGGKVGACYLVLKKNNGVKENEKEQGVCDRQEQKGFYGYRGGNGEVRYVVSNGVCGMLQEA